MKLEGSEEKDELSIWPENWQPLQVFCRLLTQWRVGVDGLKTGLHYDALPLMLEVCGVDRSEWPDVVDCVQIMERRALVLLNK